RSRLPGKWSRQEIGFQRITARPWDQYNFPARIAVLQIIARALTHAADRSLVIPVLAIEGKRRRLIVADRAQPVALRRQDVALTKRGVAALVTCIGDPFPLAKPGMIVR